MEMKIFILCMITSLLVIIQDNFVEGTTTNSPTVSTESVFTTSSPTTSSPTTSAPTTSSPSFDIITGYTLVLNLGIPYSNSNTSFVLESLNLSISGITGSDPSNVRNIALDIPQQGSRRLGSLSRNLEVQNLLHSYVLSFDVHYASSEDSGISTGLLQDSINILSNPTFNYKADSLFTETLVAVSAPENSCVDAARSDITWTKSMYVISNTTFFPLEQELGPEIGTLKYFQARENIDENFDHIISHSYTSRESFVARTTTSFSTVSNAGSRIHDTLHENGFLNGTNLEFEVKLVQGSYFALCCVDCAQPNSSMIVSISSTGDQIIVLDKTPIDDVNSDSSSKTFLIGIAIGGAVCGILLLSLCVYSYIVLNPKLKESKKELLDTRNRLKMSSMENVMLAEGWKLQWDEIKLSKKIGEGVAGEVFVGLLHGNMKVAVKTIKDSSMMSAVQDEKEISFMRRCRHPRLVLFLGYGKMPHGDVFLVLEFLSHGGMDAQIWRKSLDQEANKLIRDDRAAPSWNDRLQWLHDIANGMIFLHEKMKCCHRDLKSPNVLLSEEGGRLRAKVSDFGVSKFIPNVKRNIDEDEVEDKSGARSPRRRRMRRKVSNISSGSKEKEENGIKEEGGYWTSGVGTLEWLAPELIKGLEGNFDPMAVQMTEYDSAVDQFSFGCVMYETLELRPPWSHDRKFKFSFEIFDAVLGNERPPITESSPSAYVSLMKQCWDEDPKKRPLFSKIKQQIAKLLDEESFAHDETKKEDNGNSGSSTTATTVIEMKNMGES